MFRKVTVTAAMFMAIMASAHAAHAVQDDPFRPIDQHLVPHSQPLSAVNIPAGLIDYAFLDGNGVCWMASFPQDRVVGAETAVFLPFKTDGEFQSWQDGAAWMDIKRCQANAAVALCAGHTVQPGNRHAGWTQDFASGHDARWRVAATEGGWTRTRLSGSCTAPPPPPKKTKPKKPVSQPPVQDDPQTCADPGYAAVNPTECDEPIETPDPTCADAAYAAANPCECNPTCACAGYAAANPCECNPDCSCTAYAADNPCICAPDCGCPDYAVSNRQKCRNMCDDGIQAVDKWVCVESDEQTCIKKEFVLDWCPPQDQGGWHDGDAGEGAGH